MKIYLISLTNTQKTLPKTEGRNLARNPPLRDHLVKYKNLYKTNFVNIITKKKAFEANLGESVNFYKTDLLKVF